MLVVLIATGAIVKDYVLGSVLFAVVVLLSFAIGRGRMAASFSFAYLFLMGIFWVTTLKEESSAVADAMRVRGLALSLKNLVSKPALMFESVVVPVMLRCAKIADELAAAAVARGIDRPGRKTSYNAPRFGWVDFLPLSILAACCLLLVVAKANQGIGGLL